MSCESEFTKQALQLGKIIKRNRKRADVIWKMKLPRSVSDKFDLQYIDLKSRMEDVLELTLPKHTEYACADGFHATPIIHVFYAECTCKDCHCNDEYSFLRHQETSRRNKNPTWRQLETLLFIADMHKIIVDAANVFAANVIHECKRKKIKFERAFMFGGYTLNKKKLQSTMSKQYKLHQNMLKAIYCVSSKARVMWATLRRAVRMYHYAHKIWEYKFGHHAVHIDIRTGEHILGEIQCRGT